MPSHYLLLFAKYPYYGKVKTRLEPALGATKAQSFATIALLEVLQYFGSLSGTSVAGLNCRCVWCFAPSAAIDDVNKLLHDNGLSSQWEAWPQADEASNLGDRLSAAVQRAASTEKEDKLFEQTCTLIGSDCFHLTTSHLIAGIEKASDNVCFLQPASDGGYVSLSLPLPTPTASFDNIRWSTEETAKYQMTQLQSLGYDVEVGEVLSDVDEPKDLQQFLAEEQGSHLQTVYPRTRAFIRANVTIAR
jgi:glycosyltransferase A (GT-A) superfamily protein (DUF2064 family)